MTNQKRILRNVLSNFCWYGVVLISGFLIPRFIDEYRGAEILGIWDFGWSLQFYVGLLSLGVGSAISVLVARHRATQDWPALKISMSSSFLLLIGFSLLGVLLTAGLAAWAPKLLPEADHSTLVIAENVILALGLAASVQLLGSVFNGVITGCERFDVLNVIRGGRDIALLVLMIIVLAAGFEITALAWLVCAGEVLCALAKWQASRRLCPDLRLALGSCRQREIRLLLGFGGKTVAQTLARSGTYQLNSLLVAVFLGPVMLAIYSRQRALVMHSMLFVKQYAQVFLPTTSTLKAKGDRRALQELLMQSSKYGMYIALPLLILLVALAGPLLELWMGPQYRAPQVLAVMAVGHLLVIPQQSALSLSIGLGRHGWPALVELGTFVLGGLLTVVGLGVLGGGLLTAAAAVSIPVLLSGGVFIPFCVCRHLELKIVPYLRNMLVGPFLACAPFALGLALTRWVGGDDLNGVLAAGVVISGLVLASIYWIFVVPQTIRDGIIGRLVNRRPARSPAAMAVTAPVQASPGA